MKPLTEQALREKIEEIITTDDYSHGIQLKTIDKMYDLILSDRKAWGEYVIGEDICTCSCNFGDGCLCLSDVRLRTEQRQRNQGEKTDE